MVDLPAGRQARRSQKHVLCLHPLKLVHVELCETRLIARKLEKYFKSGFGREIITQIDAEVVER